MVEGGEKCVYGTPESEDTTLETVRATVKISDLRFTFY